MGDPTLPVHPLRLSAGRPSRRARRRPSLWALGVASGLLVGGVYPAEAASRAAPDPILYWNDVALEANRVSHTNGRGEQTGPPLSARALAIVHLAVYDAYAGSSGNPPGLPPYLPGLPAAPVAASPSAAVAGAASTALIALFPSQRSIFDA